MMIKKISLLLFVITFSCIASFASIEDFSVRNEAVPVPSNYSIQDDKYPVLISGTIWQNNWQHGTVKDYLEVGIADELTHLGIVNYNITMKFNVKGYNSSGVLIATYNDVYMELEYNNNFTSVSGTTIDASVFEFTDCHRFEYELVEVTDQGGNLLSVLPDNVYIESRIEVERFYKLNPNFIPGSVPHYLSATVVNTNELLVSWDYIKGAEEYDLEWTWINNYTGSTNASGNPMYETDPQKIDFDAFTAGHLKIYDFDMDRNATRVSTTNQHYTIPLIYDNGFIIYRLRPKGWTGTPIVKNSDGKWSTDNGVIKNRLGDYPHYFLIDGHTPQMNWQYQVSFAEEGKKKEVVSYFDGSLRNRQSITRINSNADNQVVVGETFYDYQGRGVVQAIPAPSGDNQLKYYAEFNKNISSEPYSREDFDQDVITTDCSVQTPGEMSPVSGASKYFSPNNTPTGNWQDFVPDAEKYPFSQVEYEPDNTGRIRSQSGVGKTHQLGTNHETRYFYGKAEQEELDRLFGLNVGYAEHYKKNMVVDPNGQVSISYLDPQGRTVATALSGVSPENLLPLDNTPAQATDLLIDLLNKYPEVDNAGNVITPAQDMPDTELDNNQINSTGRFPNAINDRLSMNKQHNVVQDDVEHIFNYEMEADNFSESCFDNICYPYVYDLTLAVTDQCGNEQFTSINETIGTPVGGLNAIDCNETNTYSTGDITAYLDLGTYTINKQIQVNEGAVNYYAARYVEDAASCLFSYEDFLAQEYTEIDTTGCNMTCGECLKETIVGYGGDSTIVNESTTSSQWEALYASLDQILIGNDQLTIEGWNSLYETCMESCTATNTCETLYQLLLADVAPNGQYGSTSFDQTSIYSSAYVLGASRWLYPTTPYRDEDGNWSYVEVTYPGIEYVPGATIYQIDNTGAYVAISGTGNTNEPYYVLPQSLSGAAIFVDNWEDSWAKSLVAYHPEYCYYESCILTLDAGNNSIVAGNGSATCNQPAYTNGSSFDFDQNLLAISTWQDAEQLLSNGGIEATATNTEICFNDPYFENGLPVENFRGGFVGGSNDLFNLPTSPISPFPYTTPEYFQIIANQYNMVNINTIMNSYAGTGMTMWEFAIYSVKCGTFYGTGTCTVGNFSTYTDAEKNQIWNLFKGLYASEKQKIQQHVMHLIAMRDTPDCYNGEIGVSGPFANKEKRFVDANDIVSQATGSQPGDDAATVIQNMGDIVYEGLYEQTGICPLAMELKLFLNGLAAVDHFGKNPPFDLFGFVPFTPQLYAAVVGINIQDLPNNTFIPQQIKRDIINDELVLSFIPGNGNQGCDYIIFDDSPFQDLSGINLTWGNQGSLWYVVGIPELVFTQQIGAEYHFQVLINAQIGNDPNNIIELVFNGRTCLPIGNCGLGCDDKEEGNDLSVGDILEQYFNDGISSVNIDQVEGAIQDQLLGQGFIPKGTILLSDKSKSCTYTEQISKSGRRYAGLSLFSKDCKGDQPCNCCIFFKHADTGDMISAHSISYVYGYHRNDLLNNNEFYITVVIEGIPQLVIGFSDCLDFTTEDDCCIPEPLLPVSCVEAWQTLTQGLEELGLPLPDFNFETNISTENPGGGQGNGNNGNGNGNGNGKPGKGNAFGHEKVVFTHGGGKPTFELTAEMEVFCDGSYKYFVQPYLDYLAALNITSVNDEGYITFQQFINYDSFGTAEAFTDYYITIINSGVPQQYIDLLLETNIQDFVQGDYGQCYEAYLQFLSHQYKAGLIQNVEQVLPIEDFCTTYESDEVDCTPFPTTPFPTFDFDDPDPCVQWLIDVAEYNAETAYNAYINNITADFINRYINGAMESLVENFTMQYPDGEFHRTLFYYDQGGNLVRTIPPNGQDVIFEQNYMADPTQRNAIKTARLNKVHPSTNPALLPVHTYPTTYNYNSLGQLTSQRTPDGGISYFWYDKLSRLVLSQNAKQQNLTTPTYSYTRYDDLGRIVEAGEIEQLSSLASITDEVLRHLAVKNIAADASYFNQPGNSLYDWVTGITEPNLIKKSVVKSYYDVATIDAAHDILTREEKGEIRNRITAVSYTEELDMATETLEANYDRAIHYGYDIHGNVAVKVDEYKSLEHIGFGEYLKRVDYEYDLISGNVNKVSYQTGKPDAFHHKYEYDADNRITNVYTSQDDEYYVQDAKYFYYDHGPLAREEIGDKKVQGVDYAYTIQGWLKGVNSNVIDNNIDIGKDGNPMAGNPNSFIAKDAMGFSLDYFAGDYKSRITTASDFLNNVTALNTEVTYNELYNGNIGRMATALTNTNGQPLDLIANHYSYDQLNRFKEMNSYTASVNDGYGMATNTQQYHTQTTYDANGNILSLDRKGATGDAMDELVYYYYNEDGVVAAPGDPDITNKLAYVDDNVASSNYTVDLRDQSPNNYTYDEIGQLVSDNKEHIAEIEWLVTNKVSKIHRTGTAVITQDPNDPLLQHINYPADLEFKYDAMGNRCIKIVKPWIGKQAVLSTEDYWTYTYYMRDAQGNVLTVYNRTIRDNGDGTFTEKFVPVEHHIYGSKRLGILNHYNVDGSEPGITINYLYDGTSTLYNSNGTINYNALTPQ